MLRTTCLALVLGLAIAACVDAPPEDDLGTTSSALTPDAAPPPIVPDARPPQPLEYGNLSNAIQVKRGALCLVAPTAGIGPVTQQPCLSTGTHWWKIVQSLEAPGFYYATSNDGSGRCLEVPTSPGSSSLNGLDLQVAPCHRQSSQLFAVTRTGWGEWRIQPRLGVAANLCLDIEGGGASPGARLQQFTCKTTDVDNQRFLTVPQQQEPVLRRCATSAVLEVTWYFGAFTVARGEIVNFAAYPLNIRCGAGAATAFTCPAGTDVIELNRAYVDQFRVKCGRR